jgi:hypothetical protein
LADINGDGRPEIAVCEVGPDIGQLYGRLALFRPGANPEDLWQAQVLHDRLADAHSLQVADFDGDGRPDIYVGEMGLTDWPHAQQRIFLSRGDRMESTSSTPALERTKRRSSNWTGASESSASHTGRFRTARRDLRGLTPSTCICRRAGFRRPAVNPSMTYRQSL